VRELDEDQVFHLKGFTVGGDVGLSAISYGRHTLGLAMAAEETAGKIFKDGLQISGFIELAQGMKVSPEQRDQLIELFQKFAGSHRPARSCRSRPAGSSCR
jgi:phage portal protein BeeE